MSSDNATAAAAPKRENVLVNLIFNVVLPSALLMKGQQWLHLAPWAVLVVALIFPVAYFFYDLNRRGRHNIISIIGFVSVLITGGVGLLKLPSEWIAIKEAVVPSLFGIVVIASMWTRHPLIKEFLLNPDFFDVPRIETVVREHKAEAAFDRVMKQGTLLFSMSFFLSAALNYMLARWIIHSPSGTPEFNVELGRLHMVSYPVVALPATLVGMYALWHVVKGIKVHTGLTIDDIIINTEADKKPEEETK
jgi:hypothetical protein